jgi:pimeloyl-ACP methyl ester carboxylesterase
MSRVVLVHGAMHGAWCWYRMVPRLERLGHTVEAIDLPGHGRRRIGRSPTLEDYVGAIVATLGAGTQSAVLVGHSMGGALISAACEAAPALVRSAIYLAAFIVRDGEAMASDMQDDEDSLLSKHLMPSADGTSFGVAPEAIRPSFYGECGDEDVALALACLEPQATAPLFVPIRLSPERFGRVPRTYIECLRDRAIGLRKQRLFQSFHPPQRVLSIDTDHSPFFSRPDQLASMIDAVARDGS